MSFILISFLFALFIAASIRFKWLTKSAAIVAASIGLLIFYSGSWQWLTAIVLFFSSSSILSAAGKNLKHNFQLGFAKSSKRDTMQVIANSIIALIFVIINIFDPQPLYYLLFLCAIAAANADTWATELGVFSKAKPCLITNFSRVEAGRSGGVSFLGSIAALAGSFFVIMSSMFFIHISVYNILLLTISAFLASFFDSFLGATVQAQYKDGETLKITERKIAARGTYNVLVSGYPWMTNDLVNFVSILMAPLIYLLIIKILP